MIANEWLSTWQNSWFVYLYHKCHLDDWTDIEHGVRAANMLSTIRNTILRDLPMKKSLYWKGLADTI